MFKRRFIAIVACAALTMATAAVLVGCASNSASSSAASSAAASSTATSSSAVKDALWVPATTKSTMGGTTDLVTDYTYDKGNLTKMDAKIAGFEDASNETTYEYNDDGLPVSGSSSGSDMEFTAITNDKGQLTSLTSVTKMGDEIAFTNTTQYTYDAEGNITKQEESGELGAGEDVDKLSDSIVFENGLPVLITSESTGGENEYRHETTVAYTEIDASTLLAEITMTSDGQDVSTVEATVKLDDDGNIIEVVDGAGATVFTASYCQLENPSPFVKALYGARVNTWVSLMAGSGA